MIDKNTYKPLKYNLKHNQQTHPKDNERQLLSVLPTEEGRQKPEKWTTQFYTLLFLGKKQTSKQ